MKSTLTPYRAQLISLSLVAVVAAGCSKKKSDDDSSSSPNPDTEITGVEASEDGKTVTITYKDKNENADAAFKCQVEENGQKPDWSDCDAAGLIVDVTPNGRYTFRVKALAGGVEEQSPASAIYVANGAPVTEGNPNPELKLETKILNKSDVSADYDKSTLTVNFGVEGADVNLDDIRFECKLNDAEFSRCPAGESYTFNTLQNGQSYALEVRAVHRPTNAIAASDKIQFKVALADCVATGATQPTQPAQGQGAVDASALPTDGCGQATGGGSEQPSSVHAGPQTLQIGKSYAYTLMPGYHVTEYSSTETQNGELIAYNITMDSDPFYIGNMPCDTGSDHNARPFSLVSPSGELYEYCRTTPTLDFFKFRQDFRVAFNHLEVATDAGAVTEVNHDFITLNSFDVVTMDLMQKRSAFEQQCAGRQIYKSPKIRFIDRGYWAEKVSAELYMCNTDLVIRNGDGLPFRNPAAWQNAYWVGAFFLTSDSRDLPLMDCWYPGMQPIHVGALIDGLEYDDRATQTMYPTGFCGQVLFPNMLELTFISKTPNQRPEMFAREVQAKLVKQLEEIVPMIH